MGMLRNDRITEWLRLEETLRSHLLQALKQGQPEQVAQDHVQVAFEDLQGGDLTTRLSSLFYLV